MYLTSFLGRNFNKVSLLLILNKLSSQGPLFTLIISITFSTKSGEESNESGGKSEVGPLVSDTPHKTDVMTASVHLCKLIFCGVIKEFERSRLLRD